MYPSETSDAGTLEQATTERLINEMSLAFLGQVRGFESEGFLPAEGPVEWTE